MILGKFQSTLPVRGATCGIQADSVFSPIFQSTLPVRGATYDGEPDVVGMTISIHAPRAGSDLIITGLSLLTSVFQSTLPVRGATYGSPGLDFRRMKFQSTLPVRGATAKMPKTEPFILSNFHNFKKYTDRTRTKVIIKMELWINLSPFSGANRTGNLWSLLLRTLKGS